MFYGDSGLQGRALAKQAHLRMNVACVPWRYRRRLLPTVIFVDVASYCVPTLTRNTYGASVVETWARGGRA